MSLQPVCMNVLSLEELLPLMWGGHSSQHSCHYNLPSFPLCQPLHSPYRAMEGQTPTLQDLSINWTTTSAVRGNRRSAIEDFLSFIDLYKMKFNLYGTFSL